MTEYLMLTLYSPMAAMGDIAVGEKRASSNAPLKSAIIGLVAGALGIDRSETDKHLALESGYGYGVLINKPGRPFDDYHTAQTVTQTEIRKFTKQNGYEPSTRKELMEIEKKETILSSRNYRTDALYTAALWERSQPSYSLKEIRDALLEPHYTPYFGRKACPFALPLSPAIIKTDGNLSAAFLSHIRSEHMQAIYDLIDVHHDNQDLTFHADADAITEDETLYKVKRRDRIVNRTVWQFLPREEAIAQLPKGE